MLQFTERRVSPDPVYGERTLPYYIRKMCKEDIPQVNEIDREAFPAQWPQANYRYELQNRMARYIVACDDTRVVEEPEVKPARGLSGFISRIRRWFRDGQFSNEESLPTVRPYILGFAGIWLMAEEAHITNIAVWKGYQRQGIGERLLQSIIDIALDLKASIITLEVRVSNTGAQNLYNKYGFNQAGLRRAYYTDNREDGVIMSTEAISSASFQSQFRKLKKGHLKRQSAAQYKPVQ